VFTYGIKATRGTHLAHLGLTVGDGGAPCFSPQVNVQYIKSTASLDWVAIIKGSF
jgi:hypothetical protein